MLVPEWKEALGERIRIAGSLIESAVLHFNTRDSLLKKTLMMMDGRKEAYMPGGFTFWMLMHDFTAIKE